MLAPWNLYIGGEMRSWSNQFRYCDASIYHIQFLYMHSSSVIVLRRRNLLRSWHFVRSHGKVAVHTWFVVAAVIVQLLARKPFQCACRVAAALPAICGPSSRLSRWCLAVVLIIVGVGGGGALVAVAVSLASSLGLLF